MATHLGVEVFQVGGEVVDALGVQEFADDVGGLQVADGGAVVLDGRVKVVLGVKVVRMAALDLGHHLSACLQTRVSALPPCRLVCPAPCTAPGVQGGRVHQVSAGPALQHHSAQTGGALRSSKVQQGWRRMRASAWWGRHSPKEGSTQSCSSMTASRMAHPRTT